MKTRAVQTVYDFDNFQEMIDFAKQKDNSVSLDVDVYVIFDGERCIIYDYEGNKECDCLNRFFNEDGTVNEEGFLKDGYAIESFTGTHTDWC